MNTLDSIIGLWWAAATCSAAALLTLWGAMRGLVAHRIPRVLTGVAVAVIAVSYWIEVAGYGVGAEMRRGAGWVLWPALAWTAWSGVMFSRRATEVARDAALQAISDTADRKVA